MGSRERLSLFVALVFLLSWLLVACERPLPGSETATPTPVADTSGATAGDSNTGGGLPEDAAGEGAATDSTPREEGASTDTATTSSSEAPATDTSTGDVSAETTDSAAESTAPESTEASDPDAATSTEGTTQAAETASTDSAASTTESAAVTVITIPATHTVAAGENLYRIGLKYGLSWVAIAQANGIANPNRIIVGQVLKLPNSGTGGQPEPTPSPQTEQVYTVKAGDNLYRIGLAYSLNWTLIAEANGLVNPNQIKVGQQLKIPVEKPGSTQSFMHTVQRGETLFLISLRYGVAWPSIAEANKIASPYVIFPGQTLVIPGK